MSTINFFCEDIQFVLKHKRNHKNWIKQIITEEGKTLKDLNFIFCSDPYLNHINLQFLRHPDFTDIITFDRSEKNMEISGDIFISIERVKENAQEFSVSFLHELHRVMAHGVLHLLGFSDKGREKKKIMTFMENRSLSKWEEIKSST